eukprot:TRINITY_DN761_c0_g1_i1.p1 TRINITY_DN761_c0_g1~~TRINITY_DN761_c0_g1_i1.p1  ORF type:complete len:444 (+),score=95.47 TRINITY_DN761_c0_g1_i1:37-1332(+)
MARGLFLLVVLGGIFSLAHAAYCNGKPGPGDPNVNPVDTRDPVFVRSVANGKLYTVGEGDDRVWLVHVWGSPYEMGVAHGTLLKEPMAQMFPAVWDYMTSKVTSYIKFLPSWMREAVASLGIGAALDLTYEITKKYTGDYFFEEIEGLAAGSGQDFKLIRRIHMVGELTKGACSMVGAWGTATPDGKAIHMRALDWDTEGPFKDYPAVIVYHPHADHGHAFANVGFVGWVGSLTGMSSAQVSISEIGVSYPDDSFGKESRFGVPFTFLLRDILQFDDTLDNAITRMANAHRTCNLILGVGDGKMNAVRGFQYSHSVLHVFNDMNMQPEADWHPHIKDVVYYGMDWLCPNYDIVLAQQLNKHHGNITSDVIVRDVVSVVQTGSLHIGVYDLNKMTMHVAFAAKSTASGPKHAYDRTFMRLDTRKLFAENPPE